MIKYFQAKTVRRMISIEQTMKPQVLLNKSRVYLKIFHCIYHLFYIEKVNIDMPFAKPFKIPRPLSTESALIFIVGQFHRLWNSGLCRAIYC